MGISLRDDKPDARIWAGVDYVIRKLIVAYEKTRDRIRKELPIYVWDNIKKHDEKMTRKMAKALVKKQFSFENGKSIIDNNK